MSKRRKGSRERRGTGGLRVKGKGFEGTYVVHRENGTSINISFTRKTENEINDIKAKLRLLGLVDNAVKKIKIDKYTNEIGFVYNSMKANSEKLNNNMLVKDYVDYFLFEHRKKGVRGKKVEDTTFSAYIDKGNNIKKYLGDKKVAELVFEDIESFINDLHKNTCDTTARQTRDLITSMLFYAKKDGITKENILQDEKINLKESKGKREKKIVQQEDLETFINYCMENKYYDLLFILNTGIRASELARSYLE